MVRNSPSDWREAGAKNIADTLSDIEERLGSHVHEINWLIEEIDHELNESELEDVDVDQIEEWSDDLFKEFRELADNCYELASDCKSLKRPGSTRLLKGKEPVAYSKRDGGAAHDAVYGSRAMGRSFGKNFGWRLDLSEWDKEKAERTGPESYDKVQAEGTVKYSKKIGGLPIHIVMEEDKRDPPI